MPWKFGPSQEQDSTRRSCINSETGIASHGTLAVCVALDTLGDCNYDFVTTHCCRWV